MAAKEIDASEEDGDSPKDEVSLEPSSSNKVDIGSQSSKHKRKYGSNRGGAKHIARYHDRHEDYIPVSPQHLRELSTFGWLQEGAGAVGMFFFSGAFWLAVTVAFEHSKELTKYTDWLFVCFLSVIFGIALIVIGWTHFNMKQLRIRELLESGNSEDTE